MKDGLDRTGKKNRLKNGKNFIHWNVPPDALPGSATFVCVLDRWLNDCTMLLLTRLVDHRLFHVYQAVYVLSSPMFVSSPALIILFAIL